jgi:hypothetical protein
MNTPTPTPRTDTEITFTGTYTCTHHNDAERTACPVCLVAALTAERDQLRADCENETKWAAHYLAESIAVKGERDQLRAENATLRAGQKACEACDEPTAFEVRQLRAELTAEREKSERYRLVTLRQDAELAEMHTSFAGNVHTENRVLQAELATERARLDWVFRNCKVTADDYTTGNRDVYAIHDREDLGAAMKEGAK